MSLQFGIKEPLDVSIFDFTTGALIAYIDYMADSSIITKATRLDLRG